MVFCVCIGLEVIIAAQIQTVAFRNMKLCHFVGGYHFKVTRCFHLQGSLKMGGSTFLQNLY
jgi:hypothetical protein